MRTGVVRYGAILAFLGVAVVVLSENFPSLERDLFYFIAQRPLLGFAVNMILLGLIIVGAGLVMPSARGAKRPEAVREARQIPQTTQAVESKRCKFCGGPVPLDEAFCPACGKAQG